VHSRFTGSTTGGIETASAIYVCDEVLHAGGYPGKYAQTKWLPGLGVTAVSQSDIEVIKCSISFKAITHI